MAHAAPAPAATPHVRKQLHEIQANALERREEDAARMRAQERFINAAYADAIKKTREDALERKRMLAMRMRVSWAM